MTELIESETDVLIVGAGPTGLTMAIELQRREIDCRLIEKNASSIETSRALTIQPRTLQLFEDIGVLSAVRSEGVIVNGLTAYDGSEQNQLFRLRADIVDSPYPYLLHLSQNRTEDILIDRFHELGGEVEFERELLGFGQGRETLTASVAHIDGESEDSPDRIERITAGWMFGSDGAHSRVRGTLGLVLNGVTQKQEFLVADAEIEWSRRTDEAGLWFHDDGMFVTFPMPPNERRWRLFIEVTGYSEVERPDTSVESLQRLLRKRTNDLEATIERTTWTSDLGINQRMAERYRNGRVFLAGDAAHVHSPLGGVGMNTGIQDAYNLGWKLALVVGDEAPESLLDTYEEERLPVAEDVLQDTGPTLSFLTSTNPATKILRNEVMAGLFGSEWVQSRVLRADTQLDIDYRGSSLSRIHSESPLTALTEAPSQGRATSLRFDRAARAWNAPKAGERAPQGSCRRYRTGEETLLFRELTGETGFALLLFAGTGAGTDRSELIAVAEKIRALAGDLVQPYLVAPERVARSGLGSIDSDVTVLIDDGDDLHEQYGADAPSTYLLRPDGYIGYRSHSIRTLPLIEYLDDWIVLPTTPLAPSEPVTGMTETQQTASQLHDRRNLN